jgi:EmrB/QacA subfamily drug resistance transporter
MQNSEQALPPEQGKSAFQYGAQSSGNKYYKWLALATVSIGSFMLVQDSTIFSIALPNLTTTFQTRPSVILWLTVVFLLVSTALMLIVGRLGDIFGRKKVFCAGISLFTVGLILCSVAQNIPQLILFRVIQGMGAGAVMSVMIAIVSYIFPEQERGRAIGILEAVFSVGILAGPFLGGILLDTWGWRSIFYVRAPVGLICIILALTILKEQKIPGKTVVDYLGAISLFTSITCFLLYLNLGQRNGFISPVMLALLAVSALFFFLFIRQERKHAQPVVDLNLFKIKIFTGATIAAGLLSFSMTALIFLTPFYFIDGVGYTALKAGTLIAMSPLVSIFGGPVCGWLSDKYGSRVLRPLGMGIFTLSLLIFSRCGYSTGSGQILLGFAALGLGAGMFNPTNDSTIMGAVPPDRLGTAGAMTNTIRQVGASIGTIFAGIVFTYREAAHAARLAKTNSDTAMASHLAIIGGYQDAILIACCIAALGIFASLIHKK